MSGKVGGSIASRSKVNIRGKPPPPRFISRRRKVPEKSFSLLSAQFLALREKERWCWVGRGHLFWSHLIWWHWHQPEVTLPEPSSLVATSGRHFKATFIVLFCRVEIIPKIRSDHHAYHLGCHGYGYFKTNLTFLGFKWQKWYLLASKFESQRSCYLPVLWVSFYIGQKRDSVKDLTNIMSVMIAVKSIMTIIYHRHVNHHHDDHHINHHDDHDDHLDGCNKESGGRVALANQLMTEHCACNC